MLADRQPPRIGDYALIGDCRTAALVSREGSIDWCCLPRFDSGSAFGRLLDCERGGYCAIAPTAAEVDHEDGHSAYRRRYLGDSLVLETSFRGRHGTARLLDCFAMPAGDPDGSADGARAIPARRADRPRVLRVVEGVQGEMELELCVAPRFDYGEVRPWIRRFDDTLDCAIGGNDALIIFCEAGIEQSVPHELHSTFTILAGQRLRIVLEYSRPELVGNPPPHPQAHEIDAQLERTQSWWEEWAHAIPVEHPVDCGLRRSALTLKALTYAPTGAIVAAPTTSLPEVPGGERNWDYRFAWVRDSSFSSRAFAEVGCDAEADAFRAFIMRSAAGHADELQVLYGVGGERRVGGQQQLKLAGYRASSPVCAGNGAAGQTQLDAYGEIVNLTWRWHRRGHSPDDDDWRFLVSLIEKAAERWTEPDCGIWEWAGEPEHFVHSKVICWSALDRGIRLSQECMRRAPVRRWRRVRDEIREAVEQRGYDQARGVFVQVFDRPELDAALLLLPTVEFVDWTDERMLRTVAAIQEELGAGDGLLYRYRRADGLPGDEGAFLTCSFWLVESLAATGDAAGARAVFDRASARATDLGLFSEEIDPRSDELLGNFPQGLTHLAHISAALAVRDRRVAASSAG